MDIGVLGPLLIRLDDREVDIGSPKLRALMALLVVNVGRSVPAERLIEDLWAGEPPARALVSLRAYISNLRKLLTSAGDSSPIVTKAGGYLLDVDPGVVDAVRFERSTAQGRAQRNEGDLPGAIATWDAALALWRGDALADVLYEDFARTHIVRLDEMRLSVEEDRIEALLSLGRHADAIPALEATIAVHPLRERPHAQLMLALYRAGRAPHALEVFRAFRDRLVDELGLDPSPDLTALSDAILRQDPALALPAATGPATRPDAARTPRTADASPPARPSLVGRDAERAVLDRTIERLAQGRGSLLLIGGDAGIGKTALLEELAASALERSLAVHWGACEETDGAPAFWPWIQILRSIASQLPDDEIRRAAADIAAPVSQLVPEIAELIGGTVPAVGLDPEAARFALYEAVAMFLGRIGRDRGLVLIIDDLHWADTTSLHLLAHLGPKVGSAGVVIAASYRSLAADRGPELDATLASLMRHGSAETVAVRGLDVEDVSSLLSTIVGGEAAERVALTIHDRTGGNPFFVRQLARLLEETVDPDHLVEAASSVPTGVRHVILRRLQLLPDEARQVLETAAVVGREFDMRVVARAAGVGVDVVLDHVDTAAAHGLVADAHGHASAYRFVHALVNDTIYGELPPGRVARLHAAVGAALEAQPHAPAADLAEHFWRAADLIEDDRPVTYMRRAAEEALAVLAYEQGGSLLRRALHLLSHRPGSDPHTELAIRLRLLQLLTSVLGWTADEITTVAEPVRAIDPATVDPELLPLWWSLWTFYTTRGEMRTSCDLAETLLNAATVHDDPTGLVAGHIAVAYATLHTTGSTEEALTHCQAARSAERDADPERLAATPEHLGVALRITESLAAAQAGDAERAFAAADEAIMLAAADGTLFRQVYARLFAGWTATLLSDPARTVAYTDPGIEMSEALGFRYATDLTVPANAWARAHLGEDPAGQAARIEEALETMRSVGHVHAQAQWLLLLSDIRLLGEQRAEAVEALEQAEAVLKQTGEGFYTGQVLRLRERLQTPAVASPRQPQARPNPVR